MVQLSVHLCSCHPSHRVVCCTCRTLPGDKEAERPEDNLRGLNPPLQGAPLQLRALSKVSEEASSLERESSGKIESSTGRSGKGIMTDSHGRESTSKVLGGIHEQVQLMQASCQLMALSASLYMLQYCSYWTLGGMIGGIVRPLHKMMRRV